jgi:hypothetical protein
MTLFEKADRKKVFPAIVVIGACCVISNYFVTTTHWRYSYIPDQIRFYHTAYDTAFNIRYPDVWTFAREAVLNPKGVYNMHHRADNLWNALSLRLFGPSPFGWRICSILFGLAGGFLTFLIVRKITDFPLLGGVAALLVLLSPPYYAMSHFGYNNIHAVPFMLLPVLLSLYDLNVGKVGIWLLVGMTRGLGFYTFTAGLTYTAWDILVLVCGLASSDLSGDRPSHLRRAFICGGAYVVGMAIMALPTVVQPGFFSYLFNYKRSAMSVERALRLAADALLLPVRSRLSGHGSHGAFWGVAGWLVYAGWILALLPSRLVKCSAIPRGHYLLRLVLGATILVALAVALSGYIQYTRSFILIPLFVISATLAIAPLYLRLPRLTGWLCIAILACEGIRCLYLQQRSMEGVWAQSRIFCVAGKTELPILYVTGPEPAWWRNLYHDGSNWPVVYGFADRYRTSQSPDEAKVGEIVIEDNKPTGICECDL